MSRNPFRKAVGFYEVMATSQPTQYTAGGGDNNNSNSEFSGSGSYTQGKQMDSFKSQSKSPTENSPRNVGFSVNKGEQTLEKKKKYLTAKYGQHQMLLIKKRLGVEMWIFDELRKLYNSEDDNHDCELDLEDLLNYDTDVERRQYAESQLNDAKQSPEEINQFVEELLRRAKTL